MMLPPPLGHGRGGVLGPEPRALQVDPQHPLEVGLEHLGDRGEVFDAGDVDHHVEPSEAGHRLGHRLLHILGRGDVRPLGVGGAAGGRDLVDGGQRALVVDVDAEHLRSLGGQSVGGLTADPAGGSSHDGHLVPQTVRMPCPTSLVFGRASGSKAPLSLARPRPVPGSTCRLSPSDEEPAGLGSTGLSRRPNPPVPLVPMGAGSVLQERRQQQCCFQRGPPVGDAIAQEVLGPPDAVGDGLLVDAEHPGGPGVAAADIQERPQRCAQPAGRLRRGR